MFVLNCHRFNASWVSFANINKGDVRFENFNALFRELPQRQWFENSDRSQEVVSQCRGVTRIDGARVKKQVWRPHRHSAAGELCPPSLRPCCNVITNILRLLF